MALVLGDNIFYGQNFSGILKRAVQQGSGATIFGYYVKNPSEYGVVEFYDDYTVKSIEEKPENPKSNYAIPGPSLYLIQAGSRLPEVPEKRPNPWGS